MILVGVWLFVGGGWSLGKKPLLDDADDATAQADTTAGPVVLIDVPAPVAPRLVVVPKTIDFGEMQIGQSATRKFKIANDGTATLEVGAIAIYDSEGKVAIKLSGHGPLSLAPLESELFEVELTVNELLPNDGSHAERLTVTSNDPLRPKALVALRAYVTGAYLTVIPVELQGGEYNKFAVQFTAKGPIGEWAKGKLLISSDAPNKSEWKLSLTAMPSKEATCLVQLSPSPSNSAAATRRLAPASGSPTIPREAVARPISPC